MSVIVRSPLDVAFWFLGRGDSGAAPLDAIALQNLLYLAQARWAAVSHGQKLMPATFLATDSGPIEPTIYHVFRNGPPPARVQRSPQRSRRLPRRRLAAVWTPAGEGPRRHRPRRSGLSERARYRRQSRDRLHRDACRRRPGVGRSIAGAGDQGWGSRHQMDTRQRPQDEGTEGAIRRPLRQRAGQPRDQVHPAPPILSAASAVIEHEIGRQGRGDP